VLVEKDFIDLAKNSVEVYTGRRTLTPTLNPNTVAVAAKSTNVANASPRTSSKSKNASKATTGTAAVAAGTTVAVVAVVACDPPSPPFHAMVAILAHTATYCWKQCRRNQTDNVPGD
jgi:hypothetical protein